MARPKLANQDHRPPPVPVGERALHRPGEELHNRKEHDERAKRSDIRLIDPCVRVFRSCGSTGPMMELASVANATNQDEGERRAGLWLGGGSAAVIRASRARA